LISRLPTGHFKTEQQSYTLVVPYIGGAQVKLQLGQSYFCSVPPANSQLGASVGT